MHLPAFRPLLVSAIALVVVSGLFAQAPAAPKLEFPAASPTATLKQRVGVTDIEIVYSRPSMKGREIFGNVKRVLREADATLSKAAAVTTTSAELQRKLDEVERKHSDLERRLAALEKRVG